MEFENFKSNGGAGKSMSLNRTTEIIILSLIAVAVLFIVVNTVSAGISWDSTNLGYSLVAEVGQGDTKDNAFSFKQIVDYFIANPISKPVHMPSNADLTETHGNWRGGPASQVNGTFNTDSSSVTVDDTTGFSASGKLVANSDGYASYIDYTGITGNDFDGTAWGRWYGNYDCANLVSDVWLFEYRSDIMSTNTSDKQVGSNSLVYTSDNVADKHIVAWTANIDGASVANQVNAKILDEIHFWVKPSVDITLEWVYMKNHYNPTNGNARTYGNKFLGTDEDTPFGVLAGGVWTEITIDLRAYSDDFASKISRNSRDWWNKMSYFSFMFSGVSNGDVIKIDGVDWQCSEPNPTVLVPNVYKFPAGIYTKSQQTIDFYFNDYGKTIIFNGPEARGIYADDNEQSFYWYFGYPGESGHNPQNLVLIWNTWGNDGYYIAISLNSNGDNTHVYADGLILQSTDSVMDGMALFISNAASDNYLKNSVITEVGDIFLDVFPAEISNVNIKGHRYTPWGGTADGCVVENLNLWLNQNYMWVDDGEFRNANIKSTRPTSIWGYGRDYGATADLHTKLIDCTFHDDFFAQTHYWRFYSSYTAYSMQLSIGWSVDVKVVDKDGNGIDGATVTIKNSDGTEEGTKTTNATGDIDAIDCLRYYWGPYGSGSSNYGHMNNPSNSWNHTLTITHQDYPSREFEFTLDKKIDWTIALSDTPQSSGMVNVYGTEYTSGEPGTIYAQLLYGDGTPANSKDITVNVWERMNKYIDNQAMTYIPGSNGCYLYNFTTPSNVSVFMIDVNCSDPVAYGSNEFHVSQWSQDISNINDTVNYINNTVDYINNTLVTKWAGYTVEDLYSIINYINVTRWNALTAQQLYNKADEIYNITQYINTSRWGLYNASSLYSLSDEIKNIAEYINDTRWNTYTASILYNMLDNIDNNLTKTNETVTYINNTPTPSGGGFFRVLLSNFGEINPGSDYKAQLLVFNETGCMINADALPLITLYDSNGNAVVTNAQMTNVDTGRYSYSYTTSGGQPSGQWMVLTSTTIDGNTVENVVYWELESNPPEVTLTVTDTTITDIQAEITITNEGTSPQEYTYYYWITPRVDGEIGDADTIDVASSSKLIDPSDTYTAFASLSLSSIGDYYYKARVYYGTEYSSALAMFTSTQISGGGGAGGISTKSCAVTFITTPSSTQLTITDQGSGIIIFEDWVTTGQTMRLPKGNYILTFNAEGYDEKTIQITLTSNKVITTSLDQNITGYLFIFVLAIVTIMACGIIVRYRQQNRKPYRHYPHR